MTSGLENTEQNILASGSAVMMASDARSCMFERADNVHGAKVVVINEGDYTCEVCNIYTCRKQTIEVWITGLYSSF